MQLLSLITAAMAAAVSATQAADNSAQYTGVTFYENTNYGGLNFPVPSVNRCWPLPQTLFHKASSVRFTTHNVSCALFGNRACLPPVLYAGLRNSVRSLDDIGLGDDIGSVRCVFFEDNNSE